MTLFLADENFPGSAVAAMRRASRDVAWVREKAPGIADSEVLAWALRENRVILTFDKDFGELAWRRFRETLSLSPCGIVLFRLPMPAPNLIGSTLASRVAERNDWAGHFSVIEPSRVRMRALGGKHGKDD